ncbi:zf-HC2 domain-containing protein [Nocardioides sp. JQ2195]|uniref:anti-sigma factor family protein n=1 Tax=Nocardioides sp. JQ2195 TaxID=2592334 RepID=UPI00197D228B|nr:zf-HC2 domain-containing protein [Nocardioides sp. JQ2195]
MTRSTRGPGTGCGFEHEDGAYVLGALSPEDRIAFEKHLPGCAACATSVRELAGLPGLLSRVPAPSLDADEQPMPVPDTLLPSLLRRVRARRRRQGWYAGGVAAAVTVIALSVGVAIGHHNGDGNGDGHLAANGEETTRTTDQPSQQPSTPQPSAPTSAPPTAAAREFTTVGTAPISGWVSLTSVPWGTRLDLTCSYDAGPGYEPGSGNGAGRAGNGSGQADHGSARGYTMEIVRRDGSTEEVASWTASSGRTVNLSAATSAPKADIARVVVRTSDGRPVMRLVSG